MKVFKILSHPYTLLFCFSFILISGEHWGGFYLTYVLTALPALHLQSLLAVAGAAVILASYHKVKPVGSDLTRQLLNVLGSLLLLASIVCFFKRDTAHYNWGTFEQGVPLFTLFFTGFIALCFLVNTFWVRPSIVQPRSHPLSKV